MNAIRYPSNPWGPFADDPWSSILDMGSGEAWDAAVEDARQQRLSEQRADAALQRMEAERRRSVDAKQ